MPSAQTGTLLQNYYSRNTINLHIISLFFFAYNLCKFCCCSPHKPALHHFNSISTSSQFVRTDSCLLLRRRQSENIEPAHSTKRQHHQHNSDSSEKVLDEQSPRSAFNFSSNISGARKKERKKVMPPYEPEVCSYLNGWY